MGATEDRIAKLHPIVAKKALAVIQQARSEGIDVIVTQGLRTMDEQADLYAQGRTKPGPIVTNAKPGSSYHNYGLAFDYCLIDSHGNACWDVTNEWRRVAEIGKSYGFEWGGDWDSFKDCPHLEMSFGLTVKDLLAGKQPPTETEDDYMISREDAKQIVAILGKYWKDMDGNVDVQAYTHHLANEVRKACGAKEDEEL